ncbi:hypothetical protein D3C72_1228860 [compost metagenome]
MAEARFRAARTGWAGRGRAGLGGRRGAMGIGELARVDAQGAAGVARHQVLVVRCDQRGHADAVEVTEHVHDALRVVVVEVGRGFVRDQDGRTVHDGPGDRQALLFAAGELDRVQVFLARQTHLVQRGAGAGGGRIPGVSLDGQRQHHVFERASIEQQVGVLQDDADRAAQIRPGARGQLVQPLAVDLDGPAAGGLQPADQLEQGGLAGAGRPRYENEFSRAHAEVDVGQDIAAATI